MLETFKNRYSGTPSTDLRSAPQPRSWGRREVVRALTAAGAGGAVFARALTALAQEGGAVTPDMIRRAEWISGMQFTEEER